MACLTTGLLCLREWEEEGVEQISTTETLWASHRGDGARQGVWLLGSDITVAGLSEMPGCVLLLERCHSPSVTLFHEGAMHSIDSIFCEASSEISSARDQIVPFICLEQSRVFYHTYNKIPTPDYELARPYMTHSHGSYLSPLAHDVPSTWALALPL